MMILYQFLLIYSRHLQIMLQIVLLFIQRKYSTYRIFRNIKENKKLTFYPITKKGIEEIKELEKKSNY